MEINYSNIPESYREDVKQIVESCCRQGLVITPKQAFNAWSNYSDGYAAGWLGLPYPMVDTDDHELNITQGDCDRDIKRTVEFWRDKYSFDPEFPNED